MYSAKKIYDTICAFEETEGWLPVVHSLEEVNEFKAYLDSIVTLNSNSKSTWIESVKPLSGKRQKEVRRWIENEQALCAIDSGYFESRYAYLVNECGVITKFQNRKSQEVLDLIIAELEERDLPIELLIRGSRQTGIGTKIVMKFMHRALFTMNANVTFASVMYEKSECIRQITDTAYEKLPWWLVPIRMRKGAFNNQSRISFISGMQASGLVQGFTPQCIYLSNVENYPTAHRTIEDGLLRAVHSSRNTFLALHGSKVQKSGWFDSIWKTAKEYYPKGMYRLCPVFIPWFLCSDLYPVADWLRVHPVPSDWSPLEETLKYVKLCESCVRKNALLSKILGVGWKMPVEQAWYWEMQYQEAKIRQNLEGFMEHFALEDDEEPSTETKVEDVEIDMDTLFPQPVAMQEKVGAIRQRLLEG
jgi:hypothetical protein